MLLPLTQTKPSRHRYLYHCRILFYFPFLLLIPLLYYLLVYHPFPKLFRLFRSLLHIYFRLLYHHPLLSRAITAGIIFFAADVFAQYLQGSKFCIKRLVRYVIYGLFFMGPFLYIWYEMMNKIWPRVNLIDSISKSIIEQISLEPFCIMVYLIYDGLIKRRDWKYIKKRIQKDFGGLLMKNAMFWLPANFCNYYLGTQELRVVFSNLSSFFWNVYFSARVNVLVSRKNSLKYSMDGDIHDGGTKKRLVVTNKESSYEDEQVLPSHTEVAIV